ncbi:hypothetical protein D3C81_2323250 [compost metagenome]
MSDILVLGSPRKQLVAYGKHGSGYNGGGGGVIGHEELAFCDGWTLIRLPGNAIPPTLT